MEAEGAKLPNIPDYQMVPVRTFLKATWAVQPVRAASASSVGSGSSGLTSAFHGVFIAEQVDGGGDTRQEIQNS